MKLKLFQPLSDQNQRLIIKVLKLATYLLVDIWSLFCQSRIWTKLCLTNPGILTNLKLNPKFQLAIRTQPCSFPPNRTTTQLTKHPIHSSFLFQSHIEFHLCLMRAPALLFGLFCDVLAKPFPPLLPFHSQAVRRSVLSLKMRQGNNRATSD